MKFAFFFILIFSDSIFAHNRILSTRQIVELAEKSCIFLISTNYKFDSDVEIYLENFSSKFVEWENFISLVYANLDEFFNDPYVHLKFTNGVDSPIDERNQILIVHRTPMDRSCLYKPILLHKKLTISSYDGPFPPKFDDLINFVNSFCGTYFNVAGGLTDEGIEKEIILESLYSVKDRKDKISMLELTKKCGSDLNSFFYTGLCRSPKTKSISNLILPQCETVDDPLIDAEEFRENILSRSKPTIFKRLATKWRARTKWTNDFFREKFGDIKIHVKLTSSGVFEGVEPMSLWNSKENFRIPDEVRERIQHSDLILVRPAGVEMTVNEFVDFIEKKNNKTNSNISAYMEYTHLNDYFKDLENDIKEFPFTDKLILKHLNFWFSDGNTIGKLHFDEFDNFLCQLKGKKQVILFEPHENRNLDEGYIIEGELDYKNGKFFRTNFKESTSLTMSPVNIVEPDFEKFPSLMYTYPLNCTIDEGDVLFIPAFWWHEVQSYPNAVEKRNLAVNYWYEPYFTKEFPCAECKLDFNPFYQKVF